MIPILLPPVKDETLYSWQCRLSASNQLSYRQFSLAFLGKYPFGNKTSPIDESKFFHNFHQELGACNVQSQLFLDTTCYAGLAPCLNKSEQIQFINAACRNRLLGVRPTNLTAELRFCPICWREAPIYYRPHQMPGVRICSKHHCLLNIRQKKQDDIICRPNAPQEIMERYANFTADLLHLMPDADLLITKKAIYRALKNLGYYSPGDDYSKLQAAMSDYSGYFKQSVVYYLKSQLISNAYVPIEATIAMLTFLFPSATDFISALEPTNNYDEMFNARIQEKEYALVGPYRENLLELEHSTCGRHHLTTAYGFGFGWSCPYCDEQKTDSECYQKLITYGGRKHYSLMAPYQGMGSKVTIKHEDCGQIFTAPARAFVYDGRRCKCESRYTFEQLQNKLDELGDYDLLNYISRESRLTIRHRTCGKTFSCTLSKFLKYPWCKICRPKRFRSTEFFRHEVEETGEYVLLDDFQNYKTQVRIQHLRCGTIFSAWPILFAKGRQRCPACNWMDHTDSHLIHLYHWLTAHYATNDVIFVEDIDLPFSDYGSIKSTMNGLLRHKMLCRLASGIYTFPGVTFPVQEVIAQRYISQHERVRGFYFGKSFAHQIGLLKDAPDMSYIITKKESQLHGRKVQVMQTTVYLRGSKIPITSENVLVLQLLSLLPNLMQYSDYDKDETYRRLANYVMEKRIDLSDCKAYYPSYSKCVPSRIAKIERMIADEAAKSKK